MRLGNEIRLRNNNLTCQIRVRMVPQSYILEKLVGEIEIEFKVMHYYLAK